VDYAEGAKEDVSMPDGSTLRLYKVDADYDAHDRVGALNYVQRSQEQGEVVTGLLYVDPDPVECHDIMGTVDQPLNELDESQLCPGNSVLADINETYR
jgi:2-oxoglutarate ferredoxin oxidoreductase subunit beta